MYYDLNYLFKDKGSEHTWIFLPGWAMDSRIFNTFDCGHNMLLINQLDPINYVTQLEDLLDSMSLNSFSLFGYSLGGFQAAHFLNSTTKKATRLVLCGVQKQYSNEAIAPLMQQLETDKETTLKGFYSYCFNTADDYKLFSEQFETALISLFDAPYLQGHLKTLVEVPITSLPSETIFIHGAKDGVAPISSTKRLSKRLNRPLEIIDDCGHFLFFKQRMCRRVEQLLQQPDTVG
ncbi:hypothetical protein DID80_03245 [Candidatus Marinamargulisbacteria bacterium SCGC AAA071-K20]|nr:hypothetical protein DID80_03245 [Candidatus Marinamargulisbacteria bacterium SCGC AAA071-K20]